MFGSRCFSSAIADIPFSLFLELSHCVSDMLYRTKNVILIDLFDESNLYNMDPLLNADLVRILFSLIIFCLMVNAEISVVPSILLLVPLTNCIFYFT